MADKDIDAVFRELQQFDKKLRNKIIRKAQRDGAKILAAEIKGTVHVDSGETRKNVKVRAGGRKKDTISTVVEVSNPSDSPHVGFAEFGTSRMEPHGAIRQSVIAREDEVVEAVRKGIDDGIGR